RRLTRDPITYSQLGGIERGTLRAPAGESDNRADAMALAIAAIDQALRGGARRICECERPPDASVAAPGCPPRAGGRGGVRVVGGPGVRYSAEWPAAPSAQ